LGLFGIFTTLNILFLGFFSSLLGGASKKQFFSCSTALNYSDQHFVVCFTVKENHVGIPKWGRMEREGSKKPS